MTDEQRNELAQQIWATSQEEIGKSITHAIQAELRMDVSSRARKLVGEQVDKLLRPAIEARIEDLKLLVEQVVQKMFDRVEEVAWNQIEARLGYHGEDLFNGVVRAIVADLTRGTNEVFNKRRQEVSQERQRYVAQRREREQEKEKEKGKERGQE